MKVINVEKLPEILNEWAKKYAVLAPVKEDKTSSFKNWEAGSQITLDELPTVPAKSIFFPQTESLYRYTVVKKDVDIIEERPAEEDFIVFGVRPCDLSSFFMLDDLFLTKGFIDPYYQTKREHAIIVAFLCDEPFRACFCDALGINYQDGAGADLVIHRNGDELGLAANTPKGEKLLDSVASLLTENSLPLPDKKPCDLKPNLEGLSPKLAGMFEHSYWDSAYEKCIGCGACTFLCPTCHCFDINSHNRSCGSGFKTRCWDACMFTDYTLMAGGHNPRATRKERFRNRFLHKLQFFPERYEKTLCVGCGRCIIKCPVNVDIVKIITELQEVVVNDN